MEGDADADFRCTTCYHFISIAEATLARPLIILASALYYYYYSTSYLFDAEMSGILIPSAFSAAAQLSHPSGAENSTRVRHVYEGFDLHPESV